MTDITRVLSPAQVGQQSAKAEGKKKVRLFSVLDTLLTGGQQVEEKQTKQNHRHFARTSWARLPREAA